MGLLGCGEGAQAVGMASNADLRLPSIAVCYDTAKTVGVVPVRATDVLAILQVRRFAEIRNPVVETVLVAVIRAGALARARLT